MGCRARRLAHGASCRTRRASALTPALPARRFFGCPRRTGVRPDDRRVDHHALHIRVVRHPGEQAPPDAQVVPAREARIHAIPLAVLRRQEPPLGTAPADPVTGLEEPADRLAPLRVNLPLLTQQRIHPLELLRAEKWLRQHRLPRAITASGPQRKPTANSSTQPSTSSDF